MNDNTPVKKCTKCGIEKPATLEFFSKNSKATINGLQPKCKECNALYYQKHKEEGGREVEQAYYQRNKERIRAYQIKNADHIDEVRRAYRKNNVDKIKKGEKAYKNKNREKVRDRYNDYVRRNPHVKRAIDNRRLAKKLSLEATLTTQQWIRCLEYFNHRCVVCGRPQGLWHVIAQDHWVALSKGGPTTAGNIIPLCHGKKDGTDGCNQSKRTKDPEKWLVGRVGKHKAKQIIDRVKGYFEWVKEQDSSNV